MYKVFYRTYEDESTGWSKNLFANLAIDSDEYTVSGADVNMELGKAGYFNLDLPLTNIHAEDFQRLKTYVDIYRDDEEDPFWSGRVFDKSKNFDDTYHIECEGCLAVLNDTVQPPRGYNLSFESVVADIINEHNSQVGEEKFIRIGDIELDAESIIVYKNFEEHESTLERLNKLVEDYVGYLNVRKHIIGPLETVLYLDWLVDTEDAEVDSQSIDFGYNLLDLTQHETNTEEIATILIPFGEDIETGELSVTLKSEESSIANGRYLTLMVEETAFSKSANTSDLKWTLTVVDNSTYPNYDTYVKVIINKQTVYEKQGNYNDWEFPAWIKTVIPPETEEDEEQVIDNNTYSNTVSGIQHNADGSKHIPIRLEYRIYGQNEVMVKNGMLELTNLANSSSVSAPTITSTTGFNGRYFTLDVSEESYSVVHNYSTLRWTLTGHGSASTNVAANLRVIIDGNCVYSPSDNGYNREKFPSYIADESSITGTCIVLHNADGTKSLVEPSSLNGTIVLEAEICNSADGSTYTQSVDRSSMTLTPLAGKIAIANLLAKKLTIEFADDSNGLTYVTNTTGINTFGPVVLTHTWDDINDPDELYEEAVAYLESIAKPQVEIELTAVDMSMIDSQIQRFKIGDRIRVTSAVHGINAEVFTCRKQTLNLIDPTQDRMTLGDIVEGYIRKNQKQVNYFQELSLDANALSELMSAEYLKTKDLDQETDLLGYLKTKNLDSEGTDVGFIKQKDMEDYMFEYLSAKYIEADEIYTNFLTAAEIRAGYIQTDQLDAAVINAGYIHADEIEAAYAKIDILESNYLSADFIRSNYTTTNILEANYAMINMENVNNSWIENGVIKNAAISNEMINTVSANKLTAGTIDASKINVTNLNADNLTVGTINGARIGNESIDLTKLSEEVPTKAYLDNLEDELRSIIDGNIETWTTDTLPTLNNYPASDWNTDALRKSHIGDICYVVSPVAEESGYAYRFSQNKNGTYEWTLIQDTQITNILNDIYNINGDLSNLKSFQTDISSWRTDTDDELRDVKGRTSTIEINYSTKAEAQGYANNAQQAAQNYADSAASDAQDAAEDYADQLASTLVTISTYNELVHTVDTNAATITSLSDRVDTKADGKTVETLQNTVNSIRQTATENSSTITSLSTKITQVGIGMRNYIKSSVAITDSTEDTNKAKVCDLWLCDQTTCA